MDWNTLEKTGWNFAQRNPKTIAWVAVAGFLGWLLTGLHILPRLW